MSVLCCKIKKIVQVTPFIKMNLSLIRNIDRRLGPPLCFLLTGWSWIVLRLGLRRARSDRSVRKILFVKLSEIGAVVCAYPVFRRVREEYPRAELFCLTFEQNQEVFPLLGDIIPRDNVLTISLDTPVRFVRDTLRALGRLRREKIDVAFA